MTIDGALNRLRNSRFAKNDGASASQEANSKGAGLGLPMVHGFLAQSGLVLNLESRVGSGTAAELWMPVAKTLPKDEAATPAPEARPAEAIEPLTIMSVDDDALVLMNTVLMLEDIGHSTMQAQSAEEGLKLLEQGELPDVLITDHAMPQMSGGDLLETVAKKYPIISFWQPGMRNFPRTCDRAWSGLQSLFRKRSCSRPSRT